MHSSRNLKTNASRIPTQGQGVFGSGGHDPESPRGPEPAGQPTQEAASGSVRDLAEARGGDPEDSARAGTRDPTRLALSELYPDSGQASGKASGVRRASGKTEGPEGIA